MTARANLYAGPCTKCGQNVPAGAGIAWRTGSGWLVSHRPAEWIGSPVNGEWANGCPEHEAEVTR